MSDRSIARLGLEHLARLADIVRVDRDDRFIRHSRWNVYRDRTLLVALCQGAALHYIDERSGVKDLDVWTFYSHHPEGQFPSRWRTVADFGPSILGRHPDDDGFIGRRVDLIRAVRTYLRSGRTKSAKLLAMKAVIAIDPPELRGAIVWPC